MTAKEFDEMRTKIERIAKVMMQSAQEEHTLCGACLISLFTALDAGDLMDAAACLKDIAVSYTAGDA